MTAMAAQELLKWEIPAALLELASDGDFSLVAELIDVFVEDTDEKIATLSHSLKWNARAIGAVGHSLKGSARQMNLQEFGEAAFHLERSAIPELDCQEAIAKLITAWPAARAIILAGKKAL